MSRSLRATFLAVALIVCALLAGCGEAPLKPTPMPAVVHDVITRYVSVPAGLTKSLATPERKSNLVGDVVDAYNQRGETIHTCNLRLDSIRNLSGEAVPAEGSNAPRPP